MNDEIREVLLRFGGDYKFFYQGDYIEINNWSDADPTQRRGAWTGNQYDKAGNLISQGLGAGICAGLATAYLISGRNWDEFRLYIDSQIGKSVIRGVMNFQEMNSWALKLPKSPGIKKHKVFRKALKANGVLFLKKIKLPAGFFNNNKVSEVFNNVDPRVGYNLFMWGKLSAHAVSIRFNGGNIRLFDPNRGEYSFPYIGKRGEPIKILMNEIIKYYYPRAYSSFTIERFLLRDS